MLLTNILTTAIKSAYLLANIKDYIKLSLELMATEITRSIETKTRIQVDILQVVCVSLYAVICPSCETPLLLPI